MKRWFIPMALLAVALIVVGCAPKEETADNKPAVPTDNAPTGGNPAQPPTGG